MIALLILNAIANAIVLFAVAHEIRAIRAHRSDLKLFGHGLIDKSDLGS